MTSSPIGASVTPVILTFNEEPNIERTLNSLTWAGRVVVVDSGSSDGTERIARQFQNVLWVPRIFDTHAQQWRFAVDAAGNSTPYVLALDADYQVPSAFVTELADRFVPGGFAGGIAGFKYAIHGRELAGSVYPPRLVVFRPELVKIFQRGHAQEMHVDGPLYHFEARLTHDDRKPLSRFISSQITYSSLEAKRLRDGAPLRWQDRLRKTGVMPLLVGVGAYFKSGGPLKGKASLRYAYERTIFECLLAIRVLGPEHRNDDGKAT